MCSRALPGSELLRNAMFRTRLVRRLPGAGTKSLAAGSDLPDYPSCSTPHALR